MWYSYGFRERVWKIETVILQLFPVWKVEHELDYWIIYWLLQVYMQAKQYFTLLPEKPKSPSCSNLDLQALYGMDLFMQ